MSIKAVLKEGHFLEGHQLQINLRYLSELDPELFSKIIEVNWSDFNFMIYIQLWLRPF